jgi:hypothetical protein
MIFGYLILIIAILISVIAAWYSVAGLTAIFAAAAIPVIIMGGALEAGKIVATVWLHNNWKRASWAYKVYLIPAIMALMLLTSMGIFGFLSKAHLDQNIVGGDSQARLLLYDEKIANERDTINNARTLLGQLDKAVTDISSAPDREVNGRVISSAERALQVRRQQARERTALTQTIEQSQTRIVKLQEERAPLAAEFRKIEAEVGPIKYIAALIYGDNPDQNLLEQSVRWVIILIVIVFDPLALTLILAANKQLEWARQGRGGWVHDDDKAEKSSDEKPHEDDNSAIDAVPGTPPPPEDLGTCPKCETPIKNAPGIGPFCPNPECDVVDGLAAAQEEKEQKEIEEFFWRGRMIAQALDQEEHSRQAREANAKLAELDPPVDVDALIEQAEAAASADRMLEQQLEQQKNMLETLAEEFTALETRAATAEALKADLQAQLSQAEQVKSDLRTAFDATTADQQSLAQDKQNLTRQLTNVNNTVTRLEIDVKNKQSEINSLTDVIASLQLDLQAAVALAQERNQRLNEALSQIPPPQIIVEEIPPAAQQVVDVPADPLPAQEPDYDPTLGYEQRYFTKYTAAADDTQVEAGDAGFGSTFPKDPNKGDVFLRVDYLPSKLYKFNGGKWIEIDKNSTDRLAYNAAYIEHLIQKIRSGEYDIEDLNDTEKNEIENYLRNNNGTL